MITTRTGRLSVALATAGALLAAGCGSSKDGDESACGPIRREPLDATYLVHVVGEGDDVAYTSDPPTSGPHKAGPPVQGVVDRALARPVQVGILERGDVLLQHDPDLPAAQQAELATLAAESVVVAPNPDLPAPVVATAWTYKRTCDAVDLPALQDFIDERRGKGPDH